MVIHSQKNVNTRSGLYVTKKKTPPKAQLLDTFDLLFMLYSCQIHGVDPSRSRMVLKKRVGDSVIFHFSTENSTQNRYGFADAHQSFEYVVLVSLSASIYHDWTGQNQALLHVCKHA